MSEKVINSGSLRLFSEDYSTGEVLELDLNDYEVKDRAEAQRIRKQREDYLSKKVLLSTLTDYPFVWAVYQTSTLLLEQLPSTHVSMLFYLITYCGYDGLLSTGKLPIRKEDLSGLLKVSRTTAWRFWESILGLDICSEADDGRIVVNEDYFRRGSIKQQELVAMASRGTYVTRVYVDAIRSLYERSVTSSKKTLCYLFQVIPFLNREYNIVCHNPLESDLEKIQPMNLGEFCNAIGYNDKNASRLLSYMLEPKFDGRGGVESAMRYVVSDKLRDKRSFNMFINPNVYYAGTSWDQVKILGQF